MKVKLNGLTKAFGDFKAVDNFTMTFEDGELVCLLGPSGCGKSTMLNMLSGILPVTDGTIYFDDDDVTDAQPQDRGIGLVFQNYALYPHMSVLENIAFPLEIKRVPKAQREAEARKYAELVQVHTMLDRKPSELSGGQQQRVAIARALIKQPRLLLLDEPLSNLDARLRIEMREEIRRIQQETGVTTIFVTHDQEEAMSISDKIVLMKAGQLQQLAGPQELYDDPHNQFVASFIGNPPINQLEGYIHDGKFVLADDSATVNIGFVFNDGHPEDGSTTDSSKLVEGQKVVLAIRPEAITVSQNPEESDLEATIVQRYTMGKEELAFVKVGASEIRVYLSSDYDFKKGDTVNIKFRKKGVFLFDKETGDRL